MRILWFVLGVFFILLALIGALLPLVPSAPFLLLAAWSFARSSRRVHDWLLGHPVLGPPIRAWAETGSMSRRIKWLATLSIAGTFGVSLVLAAPAWLLAVQALVLAAVAAFIWSRPENGARRGAPPRV